MKLFSILKHPIHIPKIEVKQWYLLLLCITLPNVFFLTLAWSNNLARPLINPDYLFALLILLLPSRLAQLMGIILTGLVFLIDSFALIIQIFPFLDLQSVIYFIPFTLTAPTQYLVLLTLIILSLIIWLIWTFRIAQLLPKFHTFTTILIIILLGYVFQDIRYSYYRSTLMGSNNYHLIHSPTLLWQETLNVSFHQWMLREPRLIPLSKTQDDAAKHLLQPSSPKILYIVAESLGAARTLEMQNMMLEKLNSQSVEFFNSNHFDFVGSTVQGELRELCQMNVEGGYAFRHLANNPFKNCLPNQLKLKGYYTVALHGATSILYDRHSWYPKAGFDKLLFNEHLLNLRRCNAFKGNCDSALTDIVIDEFGKNIDKPIFLYWLTLTSHSPYAKDDIYNQRFDCKKFGMRPDGDICRNYKLHTQFFDDLSVLLAHPNMKGTEVMIVGDHMPPLMGNEPIHPFLRWQVVPWYHFKIKS